MADSLTLETFAPHVGSRFGLADGPDGCPELELVEAVPGAFSGAGAGRRQPFSLFFLGPPDVVLPQQIYRLEHASLGTLEIFLVPIGRDAAGVRYQAVFN